jgi:hypothetical protein
MIYVSRIVHVRAMTGVGAIATGVADADSDG